jgi:hypothetical protein
MATVFGYVLGPFLGATATFFGVLISWILPPGRMSPSGILFMPSPIINAVVSGFLIQRRWKAAASILGAMIVVFWFTPPIQPVTEFWNVGLAVTWDKIIALSLIGLTIYLDKRTRLAVGAENQRESLKLKPWLIPLLAVFSSILVLGNNLLVAVAGGAQNLQFGDLEIPFGYPGIVNVMGVFNYIWVVIGLISLFASLMLWIKPENRRLWAVITLLCSFVSVVTGGGFIIGVLLAMVAGFLAFFGNVSYQTLSRFDVLHLFIMAFIGNEADNMWGSLIFSLPVVYGVFYSLNVDVVRWLFLVSPFAYPAIRLLQAIVGTMVAVPLLRTLRTAKLIPNMIDDETTGSKLRND